MKKQHLIIIGLCMVLATSRFGQLIVKNNSGTEVMRVDNGGNTSIVGNLGITNNSPTIQFNDSQNSTTDPATMWLHFNENQFYLLDDTDQDGAWGPGPWPFQYNGTAKMATFGRGNVAIGARDESSNHGAILSLASTGGQQAYHLDVANDRFRIHTDNQEKIWLDRQGHLAVSSLAQAGAGHRNVVADASGILRVGNASPSTKIAFCAYQSTRHLFNATNQTGGGSQIQYQSEEYDTHNTYDPNTNRFQPGVAGFYLIIGSVSVQPGTWGSTVDIIVRKNGNNYKQGAEQSMRSSSTQNNIYTVVTTVYLDADSYVDIFAASNTGSALWTQASQGGTYFMGIQL